MSSRAILFANGLLPDPAAARRLIQPGDVILAADGGSQHALSLGLTPEVIIGDLDSITPAARQQLERSAARFVPYPVDKDQTDLEIALHYALAQGYRQIIIIGALGGRLDQILGNLSLLADPQLAGADVRLDDGVEEVYFIRDHARVTGAAGDTLSLIPWGGSVAGVSTANLRWHLASETLETCRTRGISNEMLEEFAEVHIQSGLLLLVHRRSQEKE